MGQIVFIIGMMGVGKTAVGFELARLAACSFDDLDQLIESETGESPADLIRFRGEERFREDETRVLKNYIDRVLDEEGMHILACGGGTVLSAINRALLRKNGTVVLLTATEETLLKRLKGQAASRPLLNGNSTEELLESIELLLSDRKKIYAQLAQHTITTDGRTVAMTAGFVLEALGLQTD